MEKEDSKLCLDDIDGETLLSYYNEAVNCERLEMKEYSKVKLLTIPDLHKNNIVSNAAYTLFGKNVNIGLKIACFTTDEKLLLLI